MSQTQPNHDPHSEDREDVAVGAGETAPTGAPGQPEETGEQVGAGEASNPPAEDADGGQGGEEFTDADLSDLEEQFADLETGEDPLALAQQENAQLTDDLARARADYYNLTQQHNNYVRRARADQAGARTLGHGDVVEALLPVLDDIDAARAAGALTDGPFAAIASKLEQTLAGRFDFQRFGAEGDAFDPAEHEAVMATPDPQVEVETVKQVIQAGYRVGDRVIRPAKVIVANPQ